MIDLIDLVLQFILASKTEVENLIQKKYFKSFKKIIALAIPFIKKLKILKLKISISKLF